MGSCVHTHLHVLHLLAAHNEWNDPLQAALHLGLRDALLSSATTRQCVNINRGWMRPIFDMTVSKLPLGAVLMINKLHMYHVGLVMQIKILSSFLSCKTLQRALKLVIFAGICASTIALRCIWKPVWHYTWHRRLASSFPALPYSASLFIPPSPH